MPDNIIPCGYETFTAALYYGTEMGQNCIINRVRINILYNDKMPYDLCIPNGVTGWIKAKISDKRKGE